MIRLLSALFLTLVLAVPAQAERVMKTYEQPRQAPAFELPAIDGGSRQLVDYQGRYLLVNFWAVWCSPCVKEMPSMQQAFDTLKDDGLSMIAIHAGPSVDDAKKFADSLGLTFDIVVDEQMALAQWQVRALPTTFLIDREGRIVAEALGDRDWAGESLLDQLRGFLDTR